MSSFIEQVVSEMKSHPFTLVVVLGLVAVVWYFNVTHAKADDLETVNLKIDTIIELQLSATLRALHKELCTANGDRVAIQRVIDEKERLYREITGQRYEAPHCE